jgi:glycosyl transferase family 25
MPTPPIFLINLDRSPERLALMRAQANELGLAFERVAAIDGTRQLPGWMVAQFLDERGRVRGGLSEGEVGCYASHLLVFSKIVERRLEAAIVLEDDAILDQDFERMAHAAVRAAPAGWDCIHLSTDFKKPAFPVAELGPGRSLVRYRRLPVNSLGYVVSLAGASKLLAARPRVRPFDLEFRLAWLSGLEIFGTYPALARANGRLETTIRADWKDRGCTATRTRWKPGWASRLHGWFYVMVRLRPAGALHCWTRSPRSRARLSTPASSRDWGLARSQNGKASWQSDTGS